jgi:sulfite exporter TauE/SafE
VTAPPDLPAALLLGLFGSTHCLGMCGGIAGAFAFALGPDCRPARRHALLLLASTGRVGSYAAMGALLGAALPAGGAAPRILAGVLLLLMGVALAGRNLLAPLERAGQRLWRRTGEPLLRRVRFDSVPGALACGIAWGWLPCGLVYSTLAWAGSSGSAAQAAGLMACFGAGTIPLVLASGVLATRLSTLLRARGLRLLAGLCVCAFGIWTVAAAIGGHGPHHAH